MDDRQLRKALIRLAHDNEAARPHILPLLKQANPRQWAEAAKIINKGMWTGNWSMPKALKEVEDAYADAQRVLAIHQRQGVGTTEAPSLLLRVVEALEELKGAVDDTLGDLKKVTR